VRAGAGRRGRCTSERSIAARTWAAEQPAEAGHDHDGDGGGSTGLGGQSSTGIVVLIDSTQHSIVDRLYDLSQQAGGAAVKRRCGDAVRMGQQLTLLTLLQTININQCCASGDHRAAD
jgi:hypothetical protein